MMYTLENYISKTVKMNGVFVAYTNQDQSQFYPAIIIADATACCSQGLEFVLEGNPSYPEDYINDIDEAIKVNSEYKSDDFFNEIMIQREKMVLELIKSVLKE